MTPTVPRHWPAPPGGWPEWLWRVEYDGARHPGSADIGTVAEGANCQLYAYAVLDLFGRRPKPHRSSELWADPSYDHPQREGAEPLDLVLFNDTDTAWGAHVALEMGPDELLHLCSSEKTPVVWPFGRFAADPRYRHLIGVVRMRRAGSA
ncbi:hydrolase [Microbacterium sp. 22195]|uniref:hydrolase n=1 Tax=Microbacterium sp. 22195 TaxID=3453891 RepID=UPI003F83ED3B